MSHLKSIYRLVVSLIITIPVLAWSAGQTPEAWRPVPEYSVRPDPRDCFAYPECGGYFLYEINEAVFSPAPNLCTTDLPFIGYVVKCMCQLEDGSLKEFHPSCDKPTVGKIEADRDYEGYYMLVSPSSGCGGSQADDRGDD